MYKMAAIFAWIQRVSIKFASKVCDRNLLPNRKLNGVAGAKRVHITSYQTVFDSHFDLMTALCIYYGDYHSNIYENI